MRTNYKSSNQNTQANNANNSVNDVSVKNDLNVVDTQYPTKKDKVDAFVEMVEVSLDKKKKDSNDIKSDNNKESKASEKDSGKSDKVVTKQKKKISIVAIIIALLIGGATGYLISNVNAKRKIADIKGDTSIVEEYRKKLDSFYIDEENTIVADDISMSVLASFGKDIKNNEDKLGTYAKEYEDEVINIASYIGYKDDIAKYMKSETSLMCDDFNTFYNNAYKEAIKYSTSGIREKVLSDLNVLMKLRNEYLSIEYGILRIGSLSDIDEASVKLEIDGITHSVDKAYLLAMYDYIDAGKKLSEAKLAYDTATKEKKATAKSNFDVATTNLNAAKNGYLTALKAQQESVSDISSANKENSNSASELSVDESIYSIKDDTSGGSDEFNSEVS